MFRLTYASYVLIIIQYKEIQEQYGNHCSSFYFQNAVSINIVLTFKIKQNIYIAASRFREIHDFGMVSLDIASTIAEDSGVYMCKAVNNAGEAVTSTSMVVRGKIVYFDKRRKFYFKTI